MTLPRTNKKLKKPIKKQSDTASSTTVEELTGRSASEAAQGDEQEKSAEADSEEEVSDEPIVAAEQRDEAEQQKGEQKQAGLDRKNSQP